MIEIRENKHPSSKRNKNVDYSTPNFSDYYLATKRTGNHVFHVAIDKGRLFEIDYVNNNGEKSRRIINTLEILTIGN